GRDSHREVSTLGLHGRSSRPVTVSVYETSPSSAQYLLLHYGTAEQVFPYPFGPREALSFPVRCVTECLDQERLGPDARALDLGCAVGRSSFELARYCPEVIGIDYSSAFIRIASTMAETGFIEHPVWSEGELNETVRFEAPADVDRSRLTFKQGDAMNPDPAWTGFDVVLMSNLIDRLTDPRACIRALPRLLNPGGQLIITSPCTWAEEHTPRENWLGGFEEQGRPVKTEETLTKLLQPDFERVAEKNLPFLIRDHARKFQWSVAQATMWRRHPAS
ncbi:MAG: putative 4-mercaptohistidine N1-methyltransferase, partial [Verrucomicrobiota bacterium]